MVIKVVSVAQTITDQVSIISVGSVTATGTSLISDNSGTTLLETTSVVPLS